MVSFRRGFFFSSCHLRFYYFVNKGFVEPKNTNLYCKITGKIYYKLVWNSCQLKFKCIQSFYNNGSLQRILAEKILLMLWIIKCGRLRILYHCEIFKSLICKGIFSLWCELCGYFIFYFCSIGTSCVHSLKCQSFQLRRFCFGLWSLMTRKYKWVMFCAANE